MNEIENDIWSMPSKYATDVHSLIIYIHTSMLENTNLKQFLNKDIFEKENSAKALGFLSILGE